VEAPPSKQLTVGTGGFFQPGLLLQGWFVATRSTETTSTFRLRRAELHAKGEIVAGRLGYGVMIDPAKLLEFQDKTLSVSDQSPAPSDPSKPETIDAKQPVSAVAILQDFFVTAMTSFVDVSLGQFKVPVSWEGYNSSSKLLFPERALVSREFGDRRDLGLRLAKSFKYFGYSAGVFNGAGQNNLDTDNNKNVALRLEAYPIQGLVLAGVVYATVGDRSSDVKDRYEADVRFERGPFLLQAEYIRAHDLGKSAPTTDAQGFYGAVAWTFLDVLQPSLRVGYLDPDVHANVDPMTASGKDEVWHIDAGLNYYLRKHEAKLQLSYSRLQYDTRPANNEVIFAGQVAF
jgi:phosphate-selective porin